MQAPANIFWFSFFHDFIKIIIGIKRYHIKFFSDPLIRKKINIFHFRLLENISHKFSFVVSIFQFLYCKLPFPFCFYFQELLNLSSNVPFPLFETRKGKKIPIVYKNSFPFFFSFFNSVCKGHSPNLISFTEILNWTKKKEGKRKIKKVTWKYEKFFHKIYRKDNGKSFRTLKNNYCS